MAALAILFIEPPSQHLLIVERNFLQLEFNLLVGLVQRASGNLIAPSSAPKRNVRRELTAGVGHAACGIEHHTARPAELNRCPSYTVPLIVIHLHHDGL